jgi:hypothetical protein
MLKHKVISLGQFILVLIIVAFVAYRAALLMDLVPEDFSPTSVIKEEFKKFEQNLEEDAASDDITAPISALVSRTFERIENYYAEKRRLEAIEQQIEEKCGENSIFRFFMNLGNDKEAPLTCTTTNLKKSSPAKHDDSNVTPPQDYVVNPIVNPASNGQQQQQGTANIPAPATTPPGNTSAPTSSNPTLPLYPATDQQN